MAEMNNATINATINAINGYLEQQSTEKINKSKSATDFQNLKEAAHRYNYRYNSLSGLLKTYNSKKRQTKDLREGLKGEWIYDTFKGEGLIAKDVAILNSMRKLRNQILPKMKIFRPIALEFKDSLDRFLDRHITLTYVDTDGKIYFVKDGMETELWTASSATGKMALASAAKIKANSVSLDDIYQEVENSEIEEVEKRHKGILSSYTTGISRAEEDYRWTYIHENNNSKRSYLYIGNKGNFSEAYIGHIYSTDTPDTFSDVNKGIYHIWREHLIDVTNLWGGLEGDISASNHGNGFAVKSANTSLGGWENYYIVTKYIEKLPSEITKEDLLKWMDGQKVLTEDNFFAKAGEEAMKNVVSKKDFNGAYSLNENGQIYGRI